MEDLEFDFTKQLLPEEDWSKLTVNQLYDQKTLLFEKYCYLESNSYPYAKTFKELLDRMDSLIQSKY